jgi:hypothetical protein
MIECLVTVSNKTIVLANQADYPIRAKRFTITMMETGMLIKAEDPTAFKAASNAVWNALATFALMQQIQ